MRSKPPWRGQAQGCGMCSASHARATGSAGGHAAVCGALWALAAGCSDAQCSGSEELGCSSASELFAAWVTGAGVWQSPQHRIFCWIGLQRSAVTESQGVQCWFVTSTRAGAADDPNLVTEVGTCKNDLQKRKG